MGGSAAVAGPILFARYAFGPNRLGYCGPDDSAELFAEATVGGDLRALRHNAEQFEGAWPYLQLIAKANGVADPLDARVVEAYWLGNSMLENVTPALMGDSLDVRFRRRLPSEGWRWLADSPNWCAMRPSRGCCAARRMLTASTRRRWPANAASAFTRRRRRAIAAGRQVC